MLAIFAGNTKFAGRGEFVQSVDKLAREWWNSGRRPEELFTLVPENAPGEVCLAREAGRNSAVLLFTTRPFAVEYARAKKLDADVHSICASELPAHAGAWVKRGLDTFVLDCCPRCSDANLIPIEALHSPELLGYFWAIAFILREKRMRQFAASAFKSLLQKRVDDIVPTLKEMRDHVDPGCAALHHTLALLSPLEIAGQREELLVVCKKRLVELGCPALAAEVPDGVEGLMLGFARLREMAEGNFAATTPVKGMAAEAGGA